MHKHWAREKHEPTISLWWTNHHLHCTVSVCVCVNLTILCVIKPGSVRSSSAMHLPSATFRCAHHFGNHCHWRRRRRQQSRQCRRPLHTFFVPIVLCSDAVRTTLRTIFIIQRVDRYISMPNVNTCVWKILYTLLYSALFLSHSECVHRLQQSAKSQRCAQIAHTQTHAIKKTTLLLLCWLPAIWPANLHSTLQTQTGQPASKRTDLKLLAVAKFPICVCVLLCVRCQCDVLVHSGVVYLLGCRLVFARHSELSHSKWKRREFRFARAEWKSNLYFSSRATRCRIPLASAFWLWVIDIVAKRMRNNIYKFVIAVIGPVAAEARVCKCAGCVCRSKWTTNLLSHVSSDVRRLPIANAGWPNDFRAIDTQATSQWSARNGVCCLRAIVLHSLVHANAFRRMCNRVPSTGCGRCLSALLIQQNGHAILGMVNFRCNASDMHFIHKVPGIEGTNDNLIDEDLSNIILGISRINCSKI